MLPLAYADSADTTNASIAILVICAGIFVLAASMAIVPACIAWKRKIRRSDVIIPLCIVWAMLAAAVSIYAYVSQTRWTREYTLRIESGYFDPRDTSDAPSLPWVLWYVLGMIYIVLIVWTARAKQRHADSDSVKK